MKKILFIISTVFILQVCKAQADSFDYFGQTPPGKTAEKFAPGIISRTDRWELKITFSPDGKEVCFSTSDELYYTQFENNAWTEQIIAPFSVNQNFSNPIFSPDGQKLFVTQFNSNYTKGDIWVIERGTAGWNVPKLLPTPINSSSLEQSYTESNNGVIYIDTERPGGYGSWDIWRINYTPDSTIQAENIGPPVNSSTDDSEPCIAHDESYLIFSSSRAGNYGDVDLYLSFNKGNHEWTEPVNLEIHGAGINIPNGYTLMPSLSPDGKYLFFHRHDTSYLAGDIYWVSTSIIDSLRLQITSVGRDEDIIPNEIKLNQNYPNPFNPTTFISYQLPIAGNVKLSIYNLLGQEVKSLVNSYQGSGQHSLIWDGTNVNNDPVRSGVYLYRLETSSTNIIKKMILLR